MNSQILNAKKNELLNAQEAMLNAAQESKTKLTAAQEEQFANHTAEINSIDQTLARMASIEKGKKEVALPTSDVFVAGKETKSGKTQFSNEYFDAFWNQFKTRNFSNTANLNEGSNGAGGYLVPVRVDGTIVALAPYESSMRKLALCIDTDMDIKLPAQLSRTAAAAKSESTTEDQSFAGTQPTFTQVTLASHMAGVQVPISFELAADVPALQAFLNADIQRGIANWEETYFVNGNGTTQPQGILTGATAFETAALSINSILDLEGSLPAAYYPNSSYLMHRKTSIVLKKSQIAANQFQTFWTAVAGKDYLNGYPVEYSSQMPVYSASPAVNGAVCFGDFKTCMTIGSRGGNNISIKVLDQLQALSGTIVVLGYKRVDSKVRVSEAVNILTVNG